MHNKVDGFLYSGRLDLLSLYLYIISLYYIFISLYLYIISLYYIFIFYLYTTLQTLLLILMFSSLHINIFLNFNRDGQYPDSFYRNFLDF